MALDAISDLGARNVIISHEAGAFALLREDKRPRRYFAAAPVLEAVSAVGAGDVLLAGFLAARFGERPVDESLRAGVAAAAASTLEIGAGRFDPREASRFQGGVELRELEAVALE
jgi:fructose-1-phosphate kinase PfkB-like protein